MNFLELCQQTLADSGTGSVDDIEDVASENLSEFNKRIVRFVQQAWREIQIGRRDWKWMEQTFLFQTVEDTSRYAFDAMLDPDGARSIARFQRWITKKNWYLGDAGERVVLIPFEHMRGLKRVSTEAAKPNSYAIDNQNRLTFHPTPDAAYAIEGIYQTGPQPLAANDDIPEMPEQFHEAIKWRAIMILHGYDTAADSTIFAVQQFRIFYDDLLRDQTDGFVMGRTLA